MKNKEKVLRQFVRSTLLRDSKAERWMNENWNYFESNGYLITSAMRKFGLQLNEATAIFKKVRSTRGNLGEVRRYVRNRLKEMMQMGVPNFNAMDDDGLPANSKEDFRKENEKNAPKKSPVANPKELKENLDDEMKNCEICRTKGVGHCPKHFERWRKEVDLEEKKAIKESIATYKMPDGNTVLAKDNGSPMTFANFSQTKKWIDFLKSKGIEAFVPAMYQRAKYVVIKNPELLKEGGMGKLDKDATDVLDGIVYSATSKGKNAQQILQLVKKDDFLAQAMKQQNISDREMLSYIKDSASMFGGPLEERKSNFERATGTAKKEMCEKHQMPVDECPCGKRSEAKKVETEFKKRRKAIKENNADNQWRDLFYKYGGKLSVSAVQKIIKTHPVLKKSFDGLCDHKQYGGAYIVKKGEFYNWPGMFERKKLREGHGDCPYCGGSGENDFGDECEHCHGTGEKVGQPIPKKETTAPKFKVGDRVKVNGNNDGIIQKVHTGQLDGMYDVRIFSGAGNARRIVGVTTVSGNDIQKSVGEGIEKRQLHGAEDFVRKELMKPLSKREMSEDELITILIDKFGLNKIAAEMMVDRYSTEYKQHEALTKEAIDWLKKKKLNEEWKGWKPDMPVQVVDTSGAEIFPNLAAAKKKYPTLDPERSTKDFTWAMRGVVNGKDAIRFESWKVNDLLSK